MTLKKENVMKNIAVILNTFSFALGSIVVK